MKKRPPLYYILPSVIGAFIIGTLVNFGLSSFQIAIFFLDNDQLLYLFSTMAQVVGGMFGLLLTAYVFYADKLEKSLNNEDTYYDAKKSLLKHDFYVLVCVAICCCIALIICIIGISSINTTGAPLPFIINQSGLMFFVTISSIIVFGVVLLDPSKIDKEISWLKFKADQYYDATKSSKGGDFSEFLKKYNLLTDLINTFASELFDSVDSNAKWSKPQIIQSLNILSRNEIINRAKFNEINELRMYRNGLVHGTDFAIPVTAVRRVSDIYSALNDVHEAYKKFGFASTETNQAISTFYRL